MEDRLLQQLKKGVLEMLPRYTHMEGFTFKKEEKPVWADNTVWLNIYLGDQKIGNMGLLAKKASMDCGIKNLATILFDLDYYALQPVWFLENIPILNPLALCHASLSARNTHSHHSLVSLSLG